MEWDEHIHTQEIELSPKERSLLEAIERDSTCATDATLNPAKRLCRFGLAAMQPCAANDKDAVLSRIGLAHLITITEKGHDYLSYIRNREADKRADRMHNWKIAIFSALAGALLSEPLWVILKALFSR